MRFLLLLPILVISGCLTTSKQTFTDENSIRASESQKLERIIEVWEDRYGPKDSPREIIKQDFRVLDVDGILVVEEPNGDGADYYSMSMAGNRPIACFLHDSDLQEIADKHDVTLEVDREEGSSNPSPVPIQADGSTDALFSFVVEAFRDGTLSCFAPPTDGYN